MANRVEATDITSPSIVAIRNGLLLFEIQFSNASLISLEKVYPVVPSSRCGRSTSIEVVLPPTCLINVPNERD